jgi:hypothetical protein
MNFDTAMNIVKDGDFITRECWKGKKTFIYYNLIKNTTILYDHSNGMCACTPLSVRLQHDTNITSAEDFYETTPEEIENILTKL